MSRLARALWPNCAASCLLSYHRHGTHRWFSGPPSPSLLPRAFDFATHPHRVPFLTIAAIVDTDARRVSPALSPPTAPRRCHPHLLRLVLTRPAHLPSPEVDFLPPSAHLLDDRFINHRESAAGGPSSSAPFSQSASCSTLFHRALFFFPSSSPPFLPSFLPSDTDHLQAMPMASRRMSRPPMDISDLGEPRPGRLVPSRLSPGFSQAHPLCPPQRPTPANFSSGAWPARAC